MPGGPRQDLYVTFRKEILPDPEANMLAIPRKQRAMVRKGIKHGLKSEIDPTVDRFFALYADNVHRHGTPPFAKSFFARLRAVFGDRCEILTVTDPRGRPVSSVLSFYFRDEVLPYYAGDTGDAREVAANDFKYWELMRRACEKGLRFFDYGRSKRGTGLSTSSTTGALRRRRSPTSISCEGRLDSAEQPAQSEVPGDDRALEASAASGRQRNRPAHRAQPGLIGSRPFLR